MTRTLDEILRDAGVTVEGLNDHARRLESIWQCSFETAAAEAVRRRLSIYTVRPKIAAALVSHMVEQRDGRK